MKIYTDIDYVLHDFSVSFNEAIQSYLKPKKKDLSSFFSEKSYSPSLLPYIQAYNMSEELVRDLVLKANEIDGHYPTPCERYITSYINSKIKNGDEVVAVTARETRTNAEKITKKVFRKAIPVISVETKYKYLAIEDNSIYFEDHPEAIEGVLRNRKNVLIIVPSWPWNLDLPKNPNIIHLDPSNFKDIAKLIKEKTNERVLQNV